MLPLLLVLALVAQGLAQKFPANATIPFTYPLFKQCNSSWGKEIMVTETICAVGCLMSSVSMALNGHKILIDKAASDPSTLNHWLQRNGGYSSGNGLEEASVPKIDPSRISWKGFAYNLKPAVVKEMLKDPNNIVIANVDKGGHFVLVVGYDGGETNFYVNDPGFERVFYTLSEIVGWRLFIFK